MSCIASDLYFFTLVSTSNFVEYDPIAAAKGFTELPPEPSKGNSECHQLHVNSFEFLAAKKNAKKKAAKARKNAEAKKAENEVVEDIAGSFFYRFQGYGSHPKFSTEFYGFKDSLKCLSFLA